MRKYGSVSAFILVFLNIICSNRGFKTFLPQTFFPESSINYLSSQSNGLEAKIEWGKADPPLLNDITMREPTSLSGYGTHGKEFVLNDRELNRGWYSAVFNGRQYLMADSSDDPMLTGCNTLYPVFLKDQHPSLDELSETPMTLEVCTLNLDQTCDSKMEIMIRRFDMEIQYFLKPTIFNSAYCFGAGEVIKDTSVPPPCNVNLGTIKAVPELRFKEIPLTGFFKTQYQPYFQFRCVFANSSNHFYSVQWTIDGKAVATFGPSQDMDDLSLHENVFQYLPLGYKVQCSVSVSAVKFGQQTQPKYSDRFYAGVKIYNSTVYLKKGSHTHIALSLTLPIGCRHFDNFHTYCWDELRISDAAKQRCFQESVENIVESDYNKCTELIKTLYKGATWDPDKLFHFKIVTSDIDYEDKTEFLLRLKFSDVMKHTFWQNKVLPDVRVVVEDDKEYKDKVCYSRSDPHTKTADGYYFQHQQTGDFILYYNQQYNIEVQETIKSCGRSASCICGVSIRAGKDVFIVNRCGKINFLGFSQCDNGGILQVVRKSERFHTDWNKDTYKSLGQLYEYTNKMAPKDKYNVRGLCGYFDADVTNDLVHSDGKISTLNTYTNYFNRHHEEFINSWRVPYKKLYSRKRQELKSWAYLNGQYCVCQEKRQASAEALCSSTQYLECEMQNSITKIKCQINSFRKKRSPASHEKELDRLFGLMHQVENHYIRKRQANEKVISEDQARTICTDMIKGSLAFTFYKNMTASEDPNAVISQCIFDIMTKNDQSFANVHVDSVNTIVKCMINEVPAYAEANKEIVQNFLKNSCSTNCSNRGNCSEEGECICHQYYHGAICDIDERIPPIVTDIEGGGVCDIADGEDCRCFYVRGDNFLESLKCKIVTSEISITGEKISVTVELLAGGFEDVFTGICCIPKENVSSRDMFVREHKISVSNDGVHYGENNTMFVFDSTCQIHESLSIGGWSFKLKNGFCLIESACIKDKYVFLSENDTCLSCNTSASITDWTKTSCTFLPPPSDVYIGTIHAVPELRFKEIPQTKGPFKIRYHPYMQFRCAFSNSSNYYYYVQWRIDGQIIALLGPSNDMDDLGLHEEVFQDIPLGYMVQCAVTVSAVKFGQQTEPKYSENFYAGVKIYNSTVYLKKGSHAQISLSSTLPIGCKHFDKFYKECTDELRISDAADQRCLQETVNNVVKSDFTKCTEFIKTLYKGATWELDKLFHFKIVTSDIDYEDKSLFDLKLKFSGDMKHTFWQNKVLPDVRVVVIDNEDYKEKVCYSHSDPHMRTADGYYFPHQQEGNFILYYNQQYDIEVQETTKSCGQSASCTCGVSIRAGKDVFMINRCGKINFLGFSQCDDGGILQVVRRSERDYTVFTPIGTKIMIRLWGNYMNIDIKMAPKDKKNVRGLCGNFDGDETNDLAHSDGKTSTLNTEMSHFSRHHEEFINSWRVPEEKLFSRQKRALESWANLNGLYCVCQKGKKGISAEALCSSTQYHNCEMQKSITKTKCYIYSFRKKRSAASHEKEMDRLFELMQPIENHNIRKRQTNETEISEVQATERCSNKIKGSLAFTSYSNMTASEDPDAVIDQCVFDIMATNDQSFANIHVDSVNKIVKGMMDEVPTYVETNKKEVQVFLKNSCSNNCSNRGNCSDDGECICSQYYHGAICDIDERIPPVVTDIEGGGICHTGDGEDCRCFYVRGDNFLESLKCKIVTSEISILGEEIKVTIDTIAGGFEDVFTGVCCIPEENVFSQDMFIREHDVSVSSDGVHYGENNTMYIFDSTCQKLESLATSRPSFKLKNGFCFIEHACIKETYTFLSDSNICLSCNTSVSVTEWTETNLETCIPSTTTTTTSTKTTKSCPSTVATLTITDDVKNHTVSAVNTTMLDDFENQTVSAIDTTMPEDDENKTDSGIKRTTQTPETTSNMTSPKETCKEKGCLRLKERTQKLSMEHKKWKERIHRLTQKNKRLKQIVQRVQSNQKKSNNQTINIKQP